MTNSTSSTQVAADTIQTNTGSLLKPGHWRSLELLENTEAVRETLARYREALGHPVYLRPVDGGLTVISLDPGAPRTVGVGASAEGCRISELPPTEADVAEVACAYQSKVAAIRHQYNEQRFVVARIRAALENQLHLGDDLLFLHQEWRFSTGPKIDLLALEPSTGRIVIIEAKDSAAKAHDPATSAQARAYAAKLEPGWPEYIAYLQRLLEVMSKMYRPGARVPLVSSALAPRCEVWWPEEGRARVSERPTLAMLSPEPPRAPAARSINWRGQLEERQARWREQQGYPMGLHRGSPLRTRLAMPEAEAQLWNFLTPSIGTLVRDEYRANAGRRGADRKVYGYPRLFDNLLSSQPLVFNLFGELALDLDAATRVARALWPGRVDRIIRIEFEWSPGRQDPRYLNNGSAADVALFHTTPAGANGAIFIETKYYEDLRAAENTLKSRYDEVAAASDAFLRDALPSVRQGWLQQLWLDHLLLLATRHTDRLASALFVVAYPEVNARCQAAVETYAKVLDPAAPSTFEARTLERVVDAIETNVEAPWVSAFRARYLSATE